MSSSGSLHSRTVSWKSPPGILTHHDSSQSCVSLWEEGSPISYKKPPLGLPLGEDPLWDFVAHPSSDRFRELMSQTPFRTLVAALALSSSLKFDSLDIIDQALSSMKSKERSYACAYALILPGCFCFYEEKKSQLASLVTHMLKKGWADPALLASVLALCHREVPHEAVEALLPFLSGSKVVLPLLQCSSDPLAAARLARTIVPDRFVVEAWIARLFLQGVEPKRDLMDQLSPLAKLCCLINGVKYMATLKQDLSFDISSNLFQLLGVLMSPNIHNVCEMILMSGTSRESLTLFLSHPLYPNAFSLALYELTLATCQPLDSMLQLYAVQRLHRNDLGNALIFQALTGRSLTGLSQSSPEGVHKAIKACIPSGDAESMKMLLRVCEKAIWDEALELAVRLGIESQVQMILNTAFVEGVRLNTDHCVRVAIMMLSQSPRAQTKLERGRVLSALCFSPLVSQELAHEADRVIRDTRLQPLLDYHLNQRKKPLFMVREPRPPERQPPSVFEDLKPLDLEEVERLVTERHK